MKKRHNILVVLACALLAGGCDNNNLNEADFVTTVSEVCLIVNSQTIMQYDSGIHQMAWHEGKRQFRLMNDTLSDYFVVTLGKMPETMGETVPVELVYTTTTRTTTVSDNFYASKISNTSSGTMYWLWNSHEKIGVVIQELR